MKILCKEPEGEITHEIWPFSFSKENTVKLYEASAKFPVLFGRELNDIIDFTNFFLFQNLSDDVEPQGLLWVMDDFRGMFYLNEITDIEASVHYSFFDRRHKGREAIVRMMLLYVFKKYGFVRLNAYVPAYAGSGVRAFIERCGFKREGRKRNSSWWKGKWFDTYLYGILPEDLVNGSAN